MANYIDKAKMFAEFVKHKKRTMERRAAGLDDPTLPDYIGYCFLTLAKKIASRPNFSGYSFREEMESDGIENCIIAANNFDPERSEQNPFGYFTKIIWWAFLRRIEKEKKQTYVKYKAMQNMQLSGELYNGNPEDFKGMNVSVDNEFMDEVVNSFEATKERKDQKIKASKRKRGVEVLFADDEVDELEMETGDVLDAETRAALGFSRIVEDLGSVGTKKSSGAKHRG